MSILRGLTVVEASITGAAAWTGKHMADWGARVIILEPPEGSPLRYAPPYYERNGERRSGLWQWLSRGKTSVRVGDGFATGVREAQALAEKADLLLLESETASLLGLKPSEVRARFEGKTTCLLIAPSATDGPYGAYRATDLGVNALSGWMSMIGSPERDPLRPGASMNPRVTGLFGFAAVLAALRYRQFGSAPQFIDLSAQAVASSLFTAQWLVKSLTGTGGVRRGMRWPGSVIECADGYMGCSPLTDAHWKSICEMIGLETGGASSGIRVLDDEQYARAEAWFKARTRAEALAEAQGRRIPAAPVQTVAERLDCPQLNARKFWIQAEIEGERVNIPRVPYILKGTQPVQRPPLQEAPAVDEPVPLPVTTSDSPPTLPLTGLRVLDLTHFWAGPFCTQMLAALGADVIKIESVQRPDLFRYTVMPQKERPWEWGPLWHDTNCGKRAITLNLASAEGKEIFEKLVPLADVVVNNFSNRVMPGLGLSAGHLLSINPRLIFVAMPAYGPGGPWEDFVSYGVAGEQLTGCAWMTGYADGIPLTPGGICDVSVGVHGAASILLALRQRDETGKGCEVEIPQAEIFDSYYAPEHIAVQMGGPVPVRSGNHHEWMAPHNAYRGAGDDQWITIAVSSDEEFMALTNGIGRPDLAKDPRFATFRARKENEQALDDVIAAAVRDRDVRDIERELQTAGVMACHVAKANELDEEPGLLHIDFMQPLTRELTGTHLYKTWPFRFTSLDVSHKRPPPLLGEHTAEVLSGLLGLTSEDLDRLEREKITGDTPTFGAG